MLPSREYKANKGFETVKTDSRIKGDGDIIGDKIEDLTLMERKSMEKIIKIPAKVY